MSVSSFRAVVRNAGNLETENKIYGSFRSLNKFEPVFQSSKHVDIFQKFDIEPVRDVPPQPPSTTEERKKKKKARRQKESTKENDQGRESRHRSHSKEKTGLNEIREKENKQPASNEKDPDEKIKEVVRRMTSKRQRRAEKNHIEEIKHSKTDLNRLAEKENMTKNETVEKSQNSSPKIAFEESKHNSDSDGEQDAKIEIDKTKTRNSARNENVTLENTEYLKSIKGGDTLDFALSPPPQGQLIHGKIICKKGIFNEYFFYLENISQSDLYIMKATRKMTSAKIYYTIDTINYDQYGVASTTEVSCGRIVSNMSRKKFKLDLSNNFVQFSNTEILNVAFKTRPGDPRKILASASLCQGARIANNDKVTYFLKNKQPVFKMDIKQFVLNYNGRAKRSSKNNFQIIDETSPDDVLTQLGKVEDCVYHCDFAFPLCAMQAFGFALANLCR